MNPQELRESYRQYGDRWNEYGQKILNEASDEVLWEGIRIFMEAEEEEIFLCFQWANTHTPSPEIAFAMTGWDEAHSCELVFELEDYRVV